MRMFDEINDHFFHAMIRPDDTFKSQMIRPEDMNDSPGGSRNSQ